MMCEWLSCEEWRDVQLLCGGRVFSAHRAVLASVSTFLRKVLLSCPIEESPIFIVLPDFDLEAMSSVLYYIYNGEVVVHKQKIEMFLDIVKAMQIFIDQQCLKEIGSVVYDSEKYLYSYRESDLYKSNNVFVLSSEKSKDQQYITLKKGQEFRDILLQCTYRDSDLCDMQMRCQNWSEQHLPCLGNLQSPYGDRQRNKLRDSFIETYPRNGNSNGQTAGVPAISNELYRGPTSVFLTNANGKYPRADNAHSDASKRTTVSLQPALEQNYNISHDIAYASYFPGFSYIEKTSSTEFDTKMLHKDLNIAKHVTDSCIGVKNLSLQTPQKLLPIELPEHTLISNHVSSLDLRVAHLMSDKIPNQITNTKNPVKTPKLIFRNFPCYSSNVECNKIESNGVLTKGAILNKVLESPWCPRIPKDYKLFRRKDETNVCPKVKCNTTMPINDKNNNVKVTTPVATPCDLVKERFSANETREITSNSYSIASLIGKDDFKCTVCNQVFTNAESLSTHTKRHTSARYSCTECDKTFSQLRNYKYHMSVHRGTREFAATCTVCGKYFNDRGYLSSHMKIHRNRKEYKCSQCPKSFNQRVAYNMHVRIHTGVKPHVCGECGKAFSRKMLLKQHQRTHSGERPYACAHCGKRFADRSNMTLHLRLHTGVKPFSCTLCPKSFTKKHHLKSHLNFHTGAKPYACPRCKLAFTQSSNMRTHLKKCNAPEPAPIDAEEAASSLL